jgi:hypothetical protein
VLLLVALTSLTLITALAPAAFASSGLYRWVDENGVAHFTDAPTDPRFRRVGSLSGTAQGWLRLPEGIRSRFTNEIREIAASSLGVRDVFDPRENIEGGVRHLRYLLGKYPGNVSLALAAYNAGEKAVDHYGGIPPYAETQQYVQKILGSGGAGSGSSVRSVVYRYTDADGTITITNIPRGKAGPTVR